MKFNMLTQIGYKNKIANHTHAKPPKLAKKLLENLIIAEIEAKIFFEGEFLCSFSCVSTVNLIVHYITK